MQRFDLPAAELSFEGAVPFSARFSDGYSQREDPLGESRHVFIEGNGVASRLATQELVVIGELGFGIGRNFILTWELFNQTASATATLHYVSFEAFPLTAAELRQCWSEYPGYLPLVEQLIAALPRRIAGFHRIALDGGRIVLTLIYGDAQINLPQFIGHCDAWYLDGFAPSKNPELWSPMVLREVARRSRQGATCSTYSVAAQVRRSLEALGFEVTLAPGFQRKREMLTARFKSDVPDVAIERRIAVVGGGLAGSCIALSFARRGFEVTLLERSSALATGASGNAAGVFMPHLAAKPDLMTRFYLAGYHHLLRELTQLAGVIAERQGVLRLATSARLRNLLDALPELGLEPEVARVVSAEEGTCLAGSEVAERGIFFGEGGWLKPPSLVEANIREAAARVDLKMFCDVKGIEYRDGLWRAQDGAGKLLSETPFAVLANGHEALELVEWLPLEAVRGQIINLPSTVASAKLRLPVCYDGYITPAHDGAHVVGATYSHDDMELDERQSERDDMLLRLQSALPELPGEGVSVASGRVAFRTMSRDRLPLIGAVPDPARFESEFRAGGMREIPLSNFQRGGSESPNRPGLYVSVGHGSRGIISCHLSAEIVAAQVCDEPLPLPRDVLASVIPARYLAREIKRA